MCVSTCQKRGRATQTILCLYDSIHSKVENQTSLYLLQFKNQGLKNFIDPKNLTETKLFSLI